jgi:hypothetical protein
LMDAAANAWLRHLSVASTMPSDTARCAIPRTYDMKELNVRVFLLLAIKKSTLTKDVLHRRGWKGDYMCQFCGCDESITHLLFSCPLARYIWNITACAFGFRHKPKSVQHMFGSWIRSFPVKHRPSICVGASEILWSIWKTEKIMRVSGQSDLRILLLLIV